MMSAAIADQAVEGSVIARKYRLESLLGEGGMGAVWRAFNLQLEVPVAIKLLRAGPNAAELGERLRVEARAAAKLVHPSIVRVFDIGECESGEPFIVMELLNGESLGQMLARGPLAPVNALQLLLPIAEALSLAHSRGVVHRDLKPDNIFIAKDGAALQPKLLDFGIAKVKSAMLAGGPTLTQTGTLLGSPDYMSPEQAYGRSDIDERSDVWAFAVVLYEALSGKTPFSGDSCQAVLRSVIEDDPLPLELFAGIDPELSALIQRGLEKDRDARPASIFELGHSLAAWLFAHGAQEDAAGSSLEAKWLGRSTESVLLHDPHDRSTPRAQHEHATLVSVVHPSGGSSVDDSIRLPLRRGQRWIPTAVVVTAAVLAGAAWTSTHEFRPALAALGATLPTIAKPAPPSRSPAPHAAARVDVVPIAALQTPPPAPPPSPVPRTKDPEIAAKSRQAPTPTAALRKGVATPAALPQALPARESRAELLNPY